MVTLSSAELRRLFTLSALLALSAFLITCVVRVSLFQETLNSILFQSATISISASALFLIVLVKLQWKREWLARISGRPVVHGIWWGRIESNYKGAGYEAPIAFVIKQTYISLSIQSHTERISSESTMEFLEMNEKNDDLRLRYVFEMQRMANAENKFTTGYGDLRLKNRGMVLSGFYWTNSPTAGRISLELVQRDCEGINCFASAQRAAQSVKTKADK